MKGINSLFARKSNCSEASIRRIYNGKQRMTLNMLLKFCDGLEIDLKELLDGVQSKII
ncbi:MAG: helix-turn-helix domain-containing protein [Flavobacteriaceae bacterium]|nr:helix-turn-helix domain-containing protein [Flavobacteriaceae bacterium]